MESVALQELENGDIIIYPEADEANMNWIRAARLRERAEAGDDEAARQLKEWENSPTYYNE